ncbi:MAG: hypothetical protein J2P37_31765 [Ktedonobacteraceae bacterium]|nr:hypothetical protein [Ktedonobacteraceae bacterium]
MSTVALWPANRKPSKRRAHAHSQHLERLQYEAQLAERQFLRVDPDNRLVAAALEKRWNEALSALKQAEEAQVQQHKPVANTALFE